MMMMMMVMVMMMMMMMLMTIYRLPNSKRIYLFFSSTRPVWAQIGFAAASGRFGFGLSLAGLGAVLGGSGMVLEVPARVVGWSQKLPGGFMSEKSPGYNLQLLPCPIDSKY